MGRLTEDMGRLRNEIESERLSRQHLIADTRAEVTAAAQAFISNLKSSVDTLQAGFREAHADMAEAARADRNAFLNRLGGAVADLRAEAADRQAAVREALAETAAQCRADRHQAVTELRNNVARTVGDMASERGAARMAWGGAMPKAKPAAPPPPAPKAKAKAHPKPAARIEEPAPAAPQARRDADDGVMPH